MSYWDEFITGFRTASSELPINDREMQGDYWTSMQKCLGLDPQDSPLKVGTVVKFAFTRRAILSTSDLPPRGLGVVVSVKSGRGRIASHEGHVWVRFGSESEPRMIRREFLRVAEAKKGKKKRVANLTGFDMLASGSPVLIHKAQQDFWQFTKEADGSLSVQRLIESDETKEG